MHRTSPESPWETSPGGLVSALMPILRENKGVWIGWAGSSETNCSPFEHDGLYNVPLHLSNKEVSDYYEGFSNSTLWPLYHDACQTPQYDRQWWAPYVAINQRFAEYAAREAAPNGHVLVQDYHLQLVPGILRELRPDVRIGFFLHIPFPPVELFAQLPWRKRILEGMLGADVIGFQTRHGAQNFVRLVNRYTPHRGSGQAVNVDGRKVLAKEYPISIDYDRIESLASDPNIIEHAKAIRSDLGENRTIMLGVDRLDYTKGIDQRLRAVYEIFDKGNHTVNDLVLVQVSVPSRESVDEYIEVRDRIEKLVGHINGEFGTVGAVPVHYLRRSLPIEELVAYYLAADVMLVTPFRDGMNLVAKEYVASRKNEKVYWFCLSSPDQLLNLIGRYWLILTTSMAWLPPLKKLSRCLPKSRLAVCGVFGNEFESGPYTPGHQTSLTPLMQNSHALRRLICNYLLTPPLPLPDYHLELYTIGDDS